MKNLEKELLNYISGRGPKVTDKMIVESAHQESTCTMNILFKVINKELDTITGDESIEVIKNLFNYVKVMIENCNELNRKLLLRKLSRLDEKIDRIKQENRKKFVNVKKAFKEFKQTQEEITIVEDKVVEENSKSYEFVDYLIEEIRDINYLEKLFTGSNHVINLKDKNGNTLFHNMIEKYINSTLEDNIQELNYYSSIITLIFSHNEVTITEHEKKESLECIYKAIDRISIGKKQVKKNIDQIEWLKKLVDNIKGIEEKRPTIEQLASKYNIKVFFDEKILEKAKLLKTPKIGEMTSREEINDYVITIDKEEAKEIDDALSCRKLENGNYLLGVHIASILAYYPYESDIVKEAITRNRAIYLPKRYQNKENEFTRAIPIFPYSFSAENASLLEKEKRLTRSYLFEIDNYGNIVNQSFKKTIITVDKNSTYEEINNVLKNGSNNKELENTVNNLERVTKILERKYKSLTLYEQIKENTSDFSELRVKEVGAEKIVYKAMILTGNKVAEFFANNDYPCLYRVHKINEDNVRKIEAMIDNLTKSYGGENFKKLYQLIEGVYPKGWYAMEGEHDGLGLKHYCHCTSGLRRSADIIVEHALETCYDKTPTKEEIDNLQQEIGRRVFEINSKQEPIEWFVKDYKRTYQKRR